MRLIGLTALLTLACGASAPDIADADRPFIKLAKREMALVVYWRGEPEPGYHQALERSLSRRLKSAYHTEPLTRRLPGAVAALEPSFILELVEHGIDDVVLVEARRQRDRISGRVVIRALATDEVVQKLAIPAIVGKDGSAPEADRVADFVALKITHHWTDPGSAPILDPLLVANRLASARACDQALAIYRKVFANKTVTAVHELQRETSAHTLEERCENQVARQVEIDADRQAVFGVEIDAGAVSPSLAEGLLAAVAKAELASLLEKHTDKPVIVRVRPGELSLDVRYSVEHYRAVNSSRPKEIDGHPALHLHPYVPVMEALIRLKDAFAASVPAFDRGTVEEMSTLLHLRKLFGDYVEVAFAEDPGLLISDEARVRVGNRRPVVVASIEPRVSRTQRFVLGPPREADGSLTTYGLLWEFFELDR